VKVAVVDDEAPARRRLARMLREVDGVDVVGEAEDGDGALRLLETTAVDALFLDVRMPGLDGLALVQRYADLPAVVFVTAYDAYAVQAFELNAVDYLLKPVRPERLAEAVRRLRARGAVERESVARAFHAAAPAKGAARVVAAERGVIRLFDARAVTRFWALEKYTAFRADGAEHLTEEPLSALESRLTGEGFMRVHRGELVRADAIRALRSVDGGFEVELADGQRARVSRRLLAAVRAALGLA
jgi:DNA-binding LytR/AlgR family response regulator